MQNVKHVLPSFTKGTGTFSRSFRSSLIKEKTSLRSQWPQMFLPPSTGLISAVLRTFALIVSAYPYCAHKSTYHVMQRARALRTKMNNDRADGHCYSFDWISRSWTFGDPYFSFQVQIIFTIISTLSKNKQKINVRSYRKFKISIHGTQNPAKLRLQGAWNWSLNANLFFEEPHQFQD